MRSKNEAEFSFRNTGYEVTVADSLRETGVALPVKGFWQLYLTYNYEQLLNGRKYIF